MRRFSTAGLFAASGIAPSSLFAVRRSAASSMCLLGASPLLGAQARRGSARSTSKAAQDGDDDDNDFVADAAFGAAGSGEQEPAAAAASGSDSVLLARQDALGVVRQPHVPEGTRTSRLNKVVEHDPIPRGGSRAASADAPAPDEVTALLAAEESEARRGRAGDAASSDAATPLPYDDSAFAENVLKMDVDGVLDETWQDAAQAKIEDVAALVDVLRDARARDICAIDTRSKTSSWDFMIIATCESQRHMTLAAWAVSDADKWQRVAKVNRRKADPLWDVIPVGRILVNVMLQSYRQEVSVDRKWVVTRTMDPMAAAHSTASESRQLRMHGLWTLTMNLQDLEDFEVDYCKETLLSQM